MYKVNYRLAGEKKNVNSEEKKLALSNSEADEKKKKKRKDRAMQLTMQMEVQKQLHEQLLDRTLLLNPKTINVNLLRDVAGLRTTMNLKILRGSRFLQIWFAVSLLIRQTRRLDSGESLNHGHS